MNNGPTFFGTPGIPVELENILRAMNPWWEGNPGPRLPEYRRWAFDIVLRKLLNGPAPVTVIRGPRQVGKTTLQQQMIERLIEEDGVGPRRILRVQFDELAEFRDSRSPILALARWFENCVLGETFNAAARAGRGAFLFLDEAQNISDWAPQIKNLVDHHTVRILVTGSSALRIESGRDSLAGRISQVDLGTLLLREIAGLRFGEDLAPSLPFNGLEPLKRREFWEQAVLHYREDAEVCDRAFVAFSERGGYPMAQSRHDLPWHEVADQLNETVIQRAIQHDLRLGDRGQKRDPLLLEEVFRIACRYAGQAPGRPVFVNEIRQTLGADIGWQRILSYLRFLDGAMLLKLIEPLEIRLKKKKGNAKLCICDHGLRASWLEEIVPLDEEGLKKSPNLNDLAGHLVESIVGYYLKGLPHLDLAHFPERGAEPEVDYVMTVGVNRIPLEVKYQARIDEMRDTLGLRAFLEKSVYNAPFGILVTRNDRVTVRDPRIVCVPLPALLMIR